MSAEKPLVAIIMGSTSDWPTLEKASNLLDKFNISHTVEVVSAHRTPKRMYEFAEAAESNGYEIIIAGAGGAAHLPGMVAAMTTLPVIGVPIQSEALNGVDSLLSIAQMPTGIPVATMSIGHHGSGNAALMAAQILALKYPSIKKALKEYRANQTNTVLENKNPKNR